MSVKRSGAPHPAETRAIAQRSGLTVQQFAEAKRLPLEFLEELELRDNNYHGNPAIEIPYQSEDGVEIATRIRLSVDGTDKFRWKSGDKVNLYGLDRLAAAAEEGHIAIVEGESDAITLWLKNWPAIGLPGATTWNEKWADLFEGFKTIYVVIEPDKGGKAMLAWIEKSKLKDRIRFVRIEGFKDPSDLYLADPDRFDECWQAALDAATTVEEEQARRRKLARAELWHTCKHIAKSDDILEKFGLTLRANGFAGDLSGAKLLFLAVTSRLLDRPVSVVVKGLSAGGKNFLVNEVLRFFPGQAAKLMTSMSPMVLAYSKESLVHRMLVFSEAAALKSKFAVYLLRSLLSEGFIHHETVVNKKGEFDVQVIHRDGPTGFIATTTLVKLDKELETRLVTVNIEDTPQQTAAILLAQARNDREKEFDFAAWHALQDLLALGPLEVKIPFAVALAQLIHPAAARLHRDHQTLRSLISVHSLLHRARRSRSADKRFVLATLDDYEAVRALYVAQITEGVEKSVSKELRETVDAVANAKSRFGISITDLANILNLHTSSVSRRLEVAIDRGYLRNSETRPGFPANITVGDPLPEEVEILPSRERLARHYQAWLQAKEKPTR